MNDLATEGAGTMMILSVHVVAIAPPTVTNFVPALWRETTRAAREISIVHQEIRPLYSEGVPASHRMPKCDPMPGDKIKRPPLFKTNIRRSFVPAVPQHLEIVIQGRASVDQASRSASRTIWGCAPSYDNFIGPLFYLGMAVMAISRESSHQPADGP